MKHTFKTYYRPVILNIAAAGNVGKHFQSPIVNQCFITLLHKIQGGSNMTGTDLYKRTHESVPVIFEPPCIFAKPVRSTRTPSHTAHAYFIHS